MKEISDVKPHRGKTPQPKSMVCANHNTRPKIRVRRLGRGSRSKISDNLQQPAPVVA